MANKKLPSPFQYRGRWRAQVSLKNGSRPSQDFDKLDEAKQWISKTLHKDDTEQDLKLGGPTQALLADALTYYAAVYTINKGGAKAELDRINHYLEGAGQRPLRLERDEKNALVVQEFVRKKAPSAFQAHSDQRKDARSATYAHIAKLARKRCSMVSTADIRELMAHMEREGLSSSTIQKEVALLRHLFNVAATEWNWKGFANPCTGLKLGKSAVRFVFLTKPQQEALWTALSECDNPYFWPLVEVAHQTTLRRSSLLAMRWDNVDLDGRIAVLPSKTGQVSSPLSLRAVAVLRDLPRHDSGRVFPMTANAVDMAWDGVRQKAGLPHLQFRDLRHLGATELARRGLNQHHLQQVLGHKTSHMAQVYVNLVQQDVLDAMDRAEPTSPVIKVMPPVVADPKEAMRSKRSTRLADAIKQELKVRKETSSPVSARAGAQAQREQAPSSETPKSEAPARLNELAPTEPAALRADKSDLRWSTGTHDGQPDNPRHSVKVIQVRFGQRR